MSCRFGCGLTLLSLASLLTPEYSSAQSVQELELGKSVERLLSAGEVHIYRIHAGAGQYLRFEIDPNSVELAAALLSPAGDKIAETVNLAGDERTLPVSARVPVDGDYQLQVSGNGRIAGKYRLRLAELKPLLPGEEKRIAAEAALSEGKGLRVQGSKASLEHAVERLQAALPLWRELNDALDEALTLMQLGSVYFMMGDAAKYSVVEAQALSIWRSLGDGKGEGEALNNIGLAHWTMGERDLALENLRDALLLRKRAGDLRGEAETINNTATVYAESGDLQKALRLKQDVLVRWRSLGDADNEARAFNDLAVIYSRLGETERALDYFKRALALRHEIGNRRGEAVNLLNIGTEYVKADDPRKALDNLVPALKMLRETGNKSGESVALQHIGRAHAMLGEQSKALEDSEQALAIQKQLKMLRPQAFTGNYLGAAQLKLGRPQEALIRFKESLALARSVGDRMLESDTLGEMARAYRDEGEIDQALALIEQSVSLIESLRSSVAFEELRTSYLATTAGRYHLFIDLLMTLHSMRPEEGFDVRALEVSERARARGLLDLLTEARAEIREGVEPDLLAREQSLAKALDDKTQRQIRLLASSHTAEQLANTNKQIRELTLAYAELEAELRARSPRYAALTQPQPLRVAEIQQLLDPGTLLLEYSLGERRSVLWVVGPASLESFDLPKQSDVEVTARRAYEELSVHGAAPGSGGAVAALGKMLFGAAAQRLRDNRLAVVAEGVLQYIPFAALTIPGEKGLVVENHELVHLPSASTLAELRRETSGRKAAPGLVAIFADPVFGRSDPRVVRGNRPASSAPVSEELERSAKEAGILSLDRLRATRQEAQAIVNLAGAGKSLQALDFRANRETAMSTELAGYRIVHFATHALFNSRHPELSGLVLSLVDRQGNPQDGFLETAQVYNLKLGADLVVLSACETALGKEVRGEGLVGLTRGFMYAGAPRVLASLWRVPDQATTELMKRFYQAVLGQGMSPAAALRSAQTSLRSEPKWQAPYYWAGFALQGEWR
uniref:Peptidase domain protein n=1 Tax=Solibacter usitatus (strain Ellin6076) TaxID=234267 RepID=Q022H5_SOLUE